MPATAHADIILNQDPAGLQDLHDQGFKMDAGPVEPGFKIITVTEWYDGPRRPHRQLFFYVTLDGQIVSKSFKRIAQAERFIARATA